MLNLRNFLTARNPINVFTRLKHHKNNKKYLYKDGKLINGTIYYYPNENYPSVESNEEPPKLFRVERLKPMKGNPHYERRILRDFGLMEQPCFSVVKNIPENNARLWKIKHLVKITPIRFPFGEPTADDVNHTFLKENGDCFVIKNIEPLKNRLEASEKFESDKRNLDGPTLRRDTRLKWVNNWESF